MKWSIFISLLSVASCSHFRGGSLSWKPGSSPTQDESGGFGPCDQALKTSTPKNVDDDRVEFEVPLFTSDDYQSLHSISPEREPDMPVLKRRKHPMTTVKEQSMYLPLSSDSDNTQESPVKIVDYQLHVPTEPIVISSDSSDEQACIKLESGTIKYHGGNKSIPIFSSPKEALGATEIFKLCFGEFDERYICTSKPIGVQFNAVFIVNLENIDLRSLYADDNGVWSVATPRKYFRVEIMDGKVDEVISSHKENYTHILKRQYGTHVATFTQRGITFQRIIYTVFNKSGTRCRYAVLQYLHRDGTEDDVVMRPHGNARNASKRPFLKTSHDVLEDIKQEPLDVKPRKMFKEKIEKVGGPLHSSSAASEPRNLQQIYNVRRSKTAGKRVDDFTHLLSQVKESAFVHDLTIDGTSVQYVLASEKQLRDTEHFCTHPLKFSVFSIDSTYNVGNFYVTNTCFRNFKIVHADGRYRGKHPYEIGPTFVHTEKATNNFVGFFCSMLRMNPNLKTIQAIGCDGDEAMMNAIHICFQDAQKLLCCSHKKDNIQRKLKTDFRARDVAINHLLSDIFGKDTGSIHEKGLIDSNTTQEFDRKLKDMKATWDCLQQGFHSWFVKYESELFKAHLIAGITKLAQVSYHYSTNQVESTNNNVKDWLGRSNKLSFPVANRQIEEYVAAQQQEFEIAIYGNGPYEIAESHAHLQKSRHIWNSMTTEERRSALNSFWTSPICDISTTKSTSQCKSVDTPETGFSESGLPPRERTENNLSVSVDDVDLAVLPKDMLEEIWSKAQKLLSLPNSVVKAPGFDGLFVQHSLNDNTGKNPPYMVTLKKSGKCVCNCMLYKSSKICEHAVTASESKGKLKQYLEWRKKEKSTVNLTDLVTAGITSGNKPKVRKPRKGGRTPLNKKSATVQQEREPLIQDSSTNKTLQALDDIDKEKEVNEFELVYLFQTKAQSCYGCGKKFIRDQEQNNLVVRKYCERQYVYLGEKKKKWQYAYFHLQNVCIKQKFPEFKKAMLVISDESATVIPEEVKAKLISLGVDV